MLLWIIFLVLLTIWLLGIIGSWSLGVFINVLLLVMVAAFVFQVLTRRDTPA